MPRSPRVFLEGGIYDVYNRVTRGEKVFAEDQDAFFLLDVMRKIRDRDDFIGRVLDVLEISREEIAGRTKRREVVRVREILMSLGVERYGLKVTEMANVLQVKYDTASLWGRRGALRRSDDADFAGNLSAEYPCWRAGS